MVALPRLNRRARRLLVVTPCVPGSLPTQGAAIARRLGDQGVEVTTISPARTGLRRLLDVATRGLYQVARSDTVLVDVFGSRAFIAESVAILYGRLLGKRVVVTLRGGWLPDYVARYPGTYRFVLARPDARVAPHEFLRDQLRDSGIAIDEVLPNFIDIGGYPFRRRDQLAPRLLYLRGTHAIYDPETALRAFGRVQAAFPAASLTMAGRQDVGLDGCRRVIAELGLRNVDLIGLVPKGDIPKLADRHDLYLQSNRVENMPVTVIEMWACGLPVVATTAGGTPYLVRDRDDGLLAPPGDAGALAAACLELLRDPALAARLSERGRARAEALDWGQVSPRWRRLLALEETA